MLSTGFERIAKILVTLVVSQAMSVPSLAVTQYKERRQLTFVRDPAELKSSLLLPVSDKLEMVRIPYRKLKARAKYSAKDERVEPLHLYVPREPSKLSKLAAELAKPGKARRVEAMLVEKLRKLGPSNFDKMRVEVDFKLFQLIKTSVLANELAKDTHDVIVDTAKLNQNPSMRSAFLAQLRGFLPQSERSRISAKIKANKELVLEKDLLPAFPRKMIRRFLVFRGPNCFHAALAFHSQDLTRSPHVNVKEERGYHRAMINYDELWRAINKHFYEVDPQRSELKYGDMLVFFDVPDDGATSINFRWIRHTATYLFGAYTFSKGSKSPDTPYTIKTLEEEWSTWRGYTKNLGVKVFRRNSSNLKDVPPIDLTDWVY